MFSDEHAVKVDLSRVDLSVDHIQHLVTTIIDRHQLAAAMVLGVDEAGAVTAELTVRLAREPLDGNLKPLLGELIEECTLRYSAPHVHALGAQLIESLRAVNPRLVFKYRVAFIPFVAGTRRFVFIGFSGEEELRAIPENLAAELGDVLRLLALSSQLALTTKHLRTLERYVKEVGHDVASAVQACVSKLRNIARDRVPASAIQAKAREAEDEIQGAYRFAENLGVVVDPNYNIGDGGDFDLVSAVTRVVEQFSGEAKERHLELRLETQSNHLAVWGDTRAIESAIGHLLSNAIKYSMGGGYVTIKIYRFDDNGCVAVRDRGIPVKEEDRERIWEFGFRGKDALERHVNGSGIGLYSVRKIVRAHGGVAGAKWELSDPRIATFWFEIPMRAAHVLDKSQLLTRART